MSFISRNNISDNPLLVYIRPAFPVNRGVSVWQINWAFLNRSDFPNGKFLKPWSVLLLTEKQRKLFIQERRINNIGGQQLYTLPFFFCFTSFISQPAPIEKKENITKWKNKTTLWPSLKLRKNYADFFVCLPSRSGNRVTVHVTVTSHPFACALMTPHFL